MVKSIGPAASSLFSVHCPDNGDTPTVASWEAQDIGPTATIDSPAYDAVRWVFDRHADGIFVRAKTVDIDAPIETVWRIITDVNSYEQITHGEARAHMDGPMQVGAPITLQVRPNSCTGTLMGPSKETIQVLDPKLHILAWTREVPLHMGHTERFQILVPMGDKTRSFIALKLPGVVGLFTKATFGHTIEQSFNALQRAFKHEAQGAAQQSE